MEPRKVTLSLVSPRVTEATKGTQRRSLFSSFPLSEQDLVFEGLTYHTVLDGRIEVTDHPHYLMATVPLRLCDPYGYGDEHEITASGTITNLGTAETYPLIEFYGAVTDPTITIGTSTLTWTGSLLEGETLYIDCGKKTVKKGTANGLKDYAGGFPKLSSPLASFEQDVAIDMVMAIAAASDVDVVCAVDFKLTWTDRYI